MLYIYKNNTGYIYKRRIPKTDKFFVFQISRNKKTAVKIVTYFNALSKDFFLFLKRECMQWNIVEILDILESYKAKALKEYESLEEQRHISLSKVFKTTKIIPNLGEVTLSGADPEVIVKALEVYKYLSICDTHSNKSKMEQYGKDIVARATPEIKSLFKGFRSNPTNFLNFLSILFKTESEILSVDYKRAQSRFNPEYSPTLMQVEKALTNHQEKNTHSYLDTQIKANKPLSDIINDFLVIHCGYKEDKLSDSKSNAYKTKKVVDFIADYCNLELKNNTISALTIHTFNQLLQIIRTLPNKSGTDGRGYTMYGIFRNPPKNPKPRGIATIDNNLDIFKRFIEYLFNQDYINKNLHQNFTKMIENVKNGYKDDIKNGVIVDKSDVDPFKIDMLKCIFSKNSSIYNLIFDGLMGKGNKNVSILAYWTRFYVPIIMLFTGARPDEIENIKVSDVESKEDYMQIYIQEGKSHNARRIVPLHTFLTKELNFKEFIDIAIKQKRINVFETGTDEYVSKRFNYAKKDCIQKFYTKEDEFKNKKYSLYSLRHNFKTNLTLNNVNQTIITTIQGHSRNRVDEGYVGGTVDDFRNEIESKFTLHHHIDWKDFKEITKNIETTF